MQVKSLKKESSWLLRSPLEERFTSFRQASDDKRVLRGRQPTSFIAFILFVLCYFKLFCRYLSNDDMKKRKKIEFVEHKGWHNPCSWWHGRATVQHPKTAKWQRGRHGRVHKSGSKSQFFLLIQHIVSFPHLFFFSHFSLFFFLFKSLRTMLHPSVGESIKCQLS